MNQWFSRWSRWFDVVIVVVISPFLLRCSQMNRSVAVSIMRKQASTTNKCPEVKNQTQITKVANSFFFVRCGKKHHSWSNLPDTRSHREQQKMERRFQTMRFLGQFHHDASKFVNCRFDFFSHVEHTNASMKSNRIQSFVRNFKRSPLLGFVCFISSWHFFPNSHSSRENTTASKFFYYINTMTYIHIDEIIFKKSAKKASTSWKQMAVFNIITAFINALN